MHAYEEGGKIEKTVYNKCLSRLETALNQRRLLQK